jgi:hypothetical protein
MGAHPFRKFARPQWGVPTVRRYRLAVSLLVLAIASNQQVRAEYYGETMRGEIRGLRCMG